MAATASPLVCPFRLRPAGTIRGPDRRRCRGPSRAHRNVASNPACQAFATAFFSLASGCARPSAFPAIESVSGGLLCLVRGAVNPTPVATALQGALRALSPRARGASQRLSPQRLTAPPAVLMTTTANCVLAMALNATNVFWIQSRCSARRGLVQTATLSPLSGPTSLLPPARSSMARTTTPGILHGSGENCRRRAQHDNAPARLCRRSELPPSFAGPPPEPSIPPVRSGGYAVTTTPPQRSGSENLTA